MKNFDDFLKTLTQSEIASIIDECQEPLNNMKDEAERNETYLGNQYATISLFVSIGLLRRYHEWLHK